MVRLNTHVARVAFWICPLVAAGGDRRESVVRVHDGFDEYLVSFGALSASRRSLLVLTTNEGRQLATRRAANIKPNLLYLRPVAAPYFGLRQL